MLTDLHCLLGLFSISYGTICTNPHWGETKISPVSFSTFPGRTATADQSPRFSLPFVLGYRWGRYRSHLLFFGSRMACFPLCVQVHFRRAKKSENLARPGV